MSPDEVVEEAAPPAREELMGRARADPGLDPVERETVLRWAVDEDTAAVYSAEASLIRRLLAHDDVQVREVGIHDDGRTRSLPVDEAVQAIAEDSLVVSLHGRIPLRYLGVSSPAGGRSHDQHAPVVAEGVFSE
jgi:hypothetical protein